MADAWMRVEAALEERNADQRPGEFFAVITDPGKSLASIPHHDEARSMLPSPLEGEGNSAKSYSSTLTQVWDVQRNQKAQPLSFR